MQPGLRSEILDTKDHDVSIDARISQIILILLIYSHINWLVMAIFAITFALTVGAALANKYIFLEK